MHRVSTHAIMTFLHEVIRNSFDSYIDTTPPKASIHVVNTGCKQIAVGGYLIFVLPAISSCSCHTFWKHPFNNNGQIFDTDKWFPFQIFTISSSIPLLFFLIKFAAHASDI